MFILLSVDILLYLCIILYSFKIENKTSFHFNYLIVSCLLNVAYEILLLSQIYFPFLSQTQYNIKEYLLSFQFIYLLLYFSKYNMFYDKTFEKFYLFLCQFSFFIILFLMITSFTITNTPISDFFFELNTYLIALFLLILIILYIIPTIRQRNFKKEFKTLIVLFIINNVFTHTQMIYKIYLPLFLALNALICIIFNSYLLRFIIKIKGRYTND
jgi:hypothetical protein